jgi:hypothetical protein
MMWPWFRVVLFVNWSQNYLGLFLNAICMGFREVSDGEWGVVRPLLPPMFRVGRLGLMIGWS